MEGREQRAWQKWGHVTRECCSICVRTGDGDEDMWTTKAKDTYGQDYMDPRAKYLGCVRMGAELQELEVGVRQLQCTTGSQKNGRGLGGQPKVATAIYTSVSSHAVKSSVVSGWALRCKTLSLEEIVRQANIGCAGRYRNGCNNVWHTNKVQGRQYKWAVNKDWGIAKNFWRLFHLSKGVKHFTSYKLANGPT